MMENKLDDNAAGDILQEILPAEITQVQATCTRCGATAAIGALTVYMHRMGMVMRCPSCDTALIRVAQIKEHYRLDMQDVRILQIGAEA